MLLPVGSDEPIRLIGTAAIVWDLLGEGRDEEAIAEAVALRFGEEAGSIAGDVRDFLVALRDHGVVGGPS